ncbi:MAG: hypothetical protein M3512_02150 [Bacteroidota bacterium]|nr:hypothetical protein [Bacteroidota bacterium]
MENPASDFIILGYVAGGKDWRKHEIEAENLTHINYAFAKISNQVS